MIAKKADKPEPNNTYMHIKLTKNSKDICFLKMSGFIDPSYPDM